MRALSGISATELLNELGYTPRPVQYVPEEVWSFIWDDGSFLVDDETLDRFQCNHVQIDKDLWEESIDTNQLHAMLTRLKADAPSRLELRVELEKITEQAVLASQTNEELKEDNKKLEIQIGNLREEVVKKDIEIQRKSGWRGAIKELYRQIVH